MLSANRRFVLNAVSSLLVAAGLVGAVDRPADVHRGPSVQVVADDTHWGVTGDPGDDTHW